MENLECSLTVIEIIKDANDFIKMTDCTVRNASFFMDVSISYKKKNEISIKLNVYLKFKQIRHFYKFVTNYIVVTKWISCHKVILVTKLCPVVKSSRRYISPTSSDTVKVLDFI